MSSSPDSDKISPSTWERKRAGRRLRKVTTLKNSIGTKARSATFGFSSTRKRATWPRCIFQNRLVNQSISQSDRQTDSGPSPSLENPEEYGARYVQNRGHDVGERSLIKGILIVESRVALSPFAEEDKTLIVLGILQPLTQQSSHVRRLQKRTRWRVCELPRSVNKQTRASKFTNRSRCLRSRLAGTLPRSHAPPRFFSRYIVNKIKSLAQPTPRSELTLMPPLKTLRQPGYSGLAETTREWINVRSEHSERNSLSAITGIIWA